jgi:hypothetical protein
MALLAGMFAAVTLLIGWLGMRGEPTSTFRTAAKTVHTVVSVPVIVDSKSTATGPKPLTQADSGRTVALARRGDRTLRLSDRWTWSEPVVSSAAVRLDPDNYFSDPGFTEWTIVPLKSGTATIRATARPGPRQFRLTVRVD